LRPYRRAADRFIRSHATDFWIIAALAALRSLLANSGPVERISDIHRMASSAKARAALARLRRANIPPERLLAIHLAVSAAVKSDPIGPGGPPNEYRIVQVAKATHRLASGYHAVYGPTARFDQYPKSSGQALRHLGRAVDECCEHVAREHLDAIIQAAQPRASDQVEGERAAH